MKKRKSYNFKDRFKLILAIILSFAHLCIPQKNIYSQTTNEYLLKSVFLLRVANFIEWPKNAKINNNGKAFVISIYGDDPFGGKLQLAVKSQKLKIKNKNVEVKKISNLDKIEGTDILFISSSEKYKLSKIVRKIKDLPVLTVGDTKGYAERGIMINMYIEDLYLQFDVNTKTAKEADIYISSKLLAKAKHVVK